MADAVIDAQGFVPTGLETPGQHRERTVLQILDMMKYSVSSFTAGLEILADNDDGHISGHARTLAAAIPASAIFTDIMKTAEKMQPVTQEAYGPFTGAVSALLEDGAHRQALDACSVLLTLYPLDAYSIALTGSAICETADTEETAIFYDAVTRGLSHPLTDFLAADFFHEQGENAKAKELLIRARSLCEKGMDPEDMFRPEIDSLLETFGG